MTRHCIRKAVTSTLSNGGMGVGYIYIILGLVAVSGVLSYSFPRLWLVKWIVTKSNALSAFKGDDMANGESVRSDLGDLVTLLQGTTDKKRKKQGTRRERKTPSFKRTTRVDGLKVWVKELGIIQDQIRQERASQPSGGSKTLTGVGLVVELAKELLYSGIPEQVLELYAA